MNPTRVLGRLNMPLLPSARPGETGRPRISPRRETSNARVGRSPGAAASSPVWVTPVWVTPVPVMVMVMVPVVVGTGPWGDGGGRAGPGVADRGARDDADAVGDAVGQAGDGAGGGLRGGAGD